METIRETEHTKVIVQDEPDQSGACHEYGVHVSGVMMMPISFQKGPIKENGPNGLQTEDLLSICIHRLKGFQSGPFPCTENEVALGYAQLAIASLENRTKDRKQRGVEGENKE